MLRKGTKRSDDSRLRLAGPHSRPISIIEATVALSDIQAVEPGAMTSKCAASATTIGVTSSPSRALFPVVPMCSE